MLQTATVHGLGDFSRGPGTSCASVPQRTPYNARPFAFARLKGRLPAQLQLVKGTRSVLHSRSRPHLHGVALGRTRQQQQAPTATGGVASSPQGDDDTFGPCAGGARQGSTHGSGTASSSNSKASAVAAARLLRGVLEAALLPRLEAMEGRIVEAVEARVAQRLEESNVKRGEAMGEQMADMETRIVEAVERRIAKRMEAQVAALRCELLVALWEREDAARQQRAEAAGAGAAGDPALAELSHLQQQQQEEEQQEQTKTQKQKQGQQWMRQQQNQVQAICGQATLQPARRQQPDQAMRARRRRMTQRRMENDDDTDVIWVVVCWLIPGLMILFCANPGVQLALCLTWFWAYGKLCAE